MVWKTFAYTDLPQVLEIVGHKDALRLAFDVLRPGGFIHSVGMHHDPLPIGGLEAYVRACNS